MSEFVSVSVFLILFFQFFVHPRGYFFPFFRPTCCRGRVFFPYSFSLIFFTDRKIHPPVALFLGSILLSGGRLSHLLQPRARPCLPRCSPSRRAPLPTGDACRRHRCAGSRSRVGLGHRLAAPGGTGTDDELEALGGAGVSGELRAAGQEVVAVAAADLAMDGRRCSPVQWEGVMQGTKG